MSDKPRFVVVRPLTYGPPGYYFYIPKAYRKLGCTIRNQPLGRNRKLAFYVGDVLNVLFDHWNDNRKAGRPW
jgi:hypothetical protein